MKWWPSKKDKKIKIFYVGMQRCGTKSFGEFYKKNGFPVCSWAQLAKNKWGHKIYDGKYLEVINSSEFNSYQVFEDGPFYRIDFVKFLYQCFPDSIFIYFHRPAEDWFKSMITHSNGKTLGINKKGLEVHCNLYDRLQDYLFIKNKMKAYPDKINLFDNFEHYTNQYKKHQDRIRLFFNDKPASRFFEASLYDKDKFKNLEEHFGLGLTKTDEVHIHKSQSNPKEIIENYFD